MSSKFILSLLAFAFTLVGCSGDNSTGSDSTGNSDSVVTVSIEDNFFNPKSITVSPGTTVRWVLRGQMSNHTVTENDGKFDSGFRFRNEGDRFERTFTTADDGKTILYHCETHWNTDQMQGSIRVGQNAPSPPPKY